MKDAALRGLTARHLAAPDPTLWRLAADRCEELGDEAGARLWRRRGELYGAVREQYDVTRWRYVGATADWRSYGLREVGMIRLPQTVKVWAGSRATLASFCTYLNTRIARDNSLYVVRRLLGLIDRLE